MNTDDNFMYAVKFVYHLAVAFTFLVICYSMITVMAGFDAGEETCKRMDGIFLKHQEYSTHYAIACILPDATIVVVGENK